MPWKENDVMNLRTEFVLRAMSAELPFTKLCAEYGISSKTGYKWKDRFIEEGLAGLKDQSRRPHSSPTEVPESQICRLVQLKLCHSSWGPKKIHELFARQYGAAERVSLSSVKRILDKAGLVKHRRRRNAAQCGRIENRIDVKAANEVWTVDFKGWWYSCERARVEPLTVRDDFSRYVLCVDALGDSKLDTVRRRFERLFESYGLPQIIRSDNGPPFACTKAPLGLTRLSAWWVALGINLDRIAPGHPEQNGGHERMHRDISCDIEAGIEGDLAAHQAALQTWRHQFNHERPHEAIGMRVPGELYVKSTRRFCPDDFELFYPRQYLRRKVSIHGDIKISKRQIYVSAAVAGWHIGLKPVSSSRYMLWFGPLCLGQIDTEMEAFYVVQ